MEDIRQEAFQFLRGHTKMVLSVVDEADRPNCSLMLYAVAPDFTVYFGTRKAFGKYERLKKNPNVALAVVEEKLDPLCVVDIQGRAEELNGEETEKALDLLKSLNKAKYYVEDAPDFVMFAVRPEAIRFLDARSGELEMNDIEVLTK